MYLGKKDSVRDIWHLRLTKFPSPSGISLPFIFVYSLFEMIRQRLSFHLRLPTWCSTDFRRNVRLFVSRGKHLQFAWTRFSLLLPASSPRAASKRQSCGSSGIDVLRPVATHTRMCARAETRESFLMGFGTHWWLKAVATNCRILIRLLTVIISHVIERDRSETEPPLISYIHIYALLWVYHVTLYHMIFKESLMWTIKNNYNYLYID